MAEGKKDWSVKISLFECEYIELQNLASVLDVPLKKLVNKSIKLALYDFKKNKHIKRSGKLEYFEDIEINTYSFKIKEKHYEKLKLIGNNLEMNVKEIVKCILSYYPEKVVDVEEQALESYLLRMDEEATNDE